MNGFIKKIREAIQGVIEKIKSIGQKPAGLGYTTSVAVDPQHKLIHICHLTDNTKMTFTHETEAYKTRPYDEEFFSTLLKVLNRYIEKHPSESNVDTNVVLPNTLISTDMINVPVLRGNKSPRSLDVLIEELYKNIDDLKVSKTLVAQNKQYASYGITLIRADILAGFYKVCASSKMTPKAVSYTAIAETNAIAVIMPKMKAATYLLMDLKSDITYISFVNRGKTVGYYELPFGFAIMTKNRLVPEDMLFDHEEAELLVLNAKEKAKAKQLTVSGQKSSSAFSSSAVSAEGGEDEEFTETDFSAAPADMPVSGTVKELPKKQPRKLPKFMMRPAPNSEQEYAYENFRIFMKWALNLIQTNKPSFHEPVKTVLVNMPKEFEFLFDYANAEIEENGTRFSRVKGQSIGAEILSNLELFGGFCENPANKGSQF